MNQIVAPNRTDIAMLDDPLRAERQDFDRIPVVDLSAFRDGSDPEAVTKEIRWAFSNVGFLYLRGHGVPQQTVDAAFSATKDFFDLPEAEKSAVDIRTSGPTLRGYTGVFGENTNPGVTLDLKECYDAGPDRPDQFGPFRGMTPWPALPGFKDAIETYLSAVTDLSALFLEAVALGLGLDRTYFEAQRRDPIMIQRLLYYPSQTGFVDESVIGIGAHTDYGLMTVLAQDPVGGLQVMNRSGDWVEAPPIEGSFVINIGDLMQRLTNDVYLANLHRVVNVSGRERYSMPCFVDSDADAVFEPLDTFITPERPAAYGPTTVLAHKTARYAASFKDMVRGADDIAVG